MTTILRPYFAEISQKNYIFSRDIPNLSALQRAAVDSPGLGIPTVSLAARLSIGLGIPTVSLSTRLSIGLGIPTVSLSTRSSISLY